MDLPEEYAGLKQMLSDAAEAIPKNGKALIISHYDTDGLCSAAILKKALERIGLKTDIQIFSQLTPDIFKHFHGLKGYGLIMFSDLGSSHITNISDTWKSCPVIILDHHIIKENMVLPKNIFLVNPGLLDNDFSSEVSASGLCFMLSDMLDSKNKDMAHIALIGAIGDAQAKGGLFTGLNKNIFEIAQSLGQMKAEKGIRWFGIETKPLFRLLMKSYDPIIPQVTDNEEGTLSFLNELGIPDKDLWIKRYGELDESEKISLEKMLISRRKDEKVPEDIYGTRLILPKEEESTPFRDAKEFSTLLNACGRLGYYNTGIGCCLGNAEDKKDASQILSEYRQEIIFSLKACSNKESIIYESDEYVLIDAKDNIRGSLIGIVASILSRSIDRYNGKTVVVMGDDGDELKVSVRCTLCRLSAEDISRKLVEKAGGQSGGHENAAGALIPVNKRHEIKEMLKEIFSPLGL